MVEREVKTVIMLPEGKHEGVINAVEERTTPHEYTDYKIQVKGGGEIKYGVPSDITKDENGEPKSKHAKLLQQLGFDLSSDKIDTDKAKGLEVEFMIVHEKTQKGTFANVVDNSVRKK